MHSAKLIITLNHKGWFFKDEEKLKINLEFFKELTT